MTTLRLRRGRGDAKLEQLNPEQTQQLLTWLQDEKSTYVNVAALVQQHFGVSVGKSAVGRYWRRHIFPRSFLEEAGVKGKLETMPMEKFEDAFAKVATLAAEKALERPHPPIQLVISLVKIVSVTKRDALARRKLRHKERRLEIDEKKEKRAADAYKKRQEEREEAMRPRTDEEEAELARKIYGHVPEAEEDAPRKKRRRLGFPPGFGQISPLFPAQSHVDDTAAPADPNAAKTPEEPAPPAASPETPAEPVAPSVPAEPVYKPLREHEAVDAFGNPRKRKPEEVPEDDTPHPNTLDYSHLLKHDAIAYFHYLWNRWDIKRRADEQPTPLTPY